LERRAVMQRREVAHLLDCPLHRGVHEHRLAEARAAVDDPMGRRVGRRESVRGPGLLPVDEVQLEARRARVDD
jgi:hypothetical protein